MLISACKNKMAGMISSVTYHFHFTIFPMLLMLIVPNFILSLWYMVVKCDGSVMEFYDVITQKGAHEYIRALWSSVDIKNPFAIVVISGYSLWALLLQAIIPARTVKGPITPNGNTPIYTDNGFYNYVITMLVFGAVTYVCKTHYGITPTLVYDHFGDILACLNIYSLLLCVGLYLKGRFAPSSTDSGTSGNIVFDYYWGTELYPRVFGLDIKVFTNCRFGMTVWPLLTTIFALKNYEQYGFVDSTWVSWILYMSYFTKFFWWESGYMRTIDIMVDRAGFYICWGCLVFVPGFYTSVSLYLASHPVKLGPSISAFILFGGFASVAVNYLADKQKQDVRESDGHCKIWGKRPEIIRAKYRLKDGSTRQSLLLVSGYWGIARHFHYLPELALTFFWSAPALFTHIMPYFYFLYLCVLLIHRTFRDDEKCEQKYTTYWNQYCKRVPYKIIPYIF